MDNLDQTLLVCRIIEEIKANPSNKITFYDFMRMALYEAELGYYTKDKTKIGKNADFYTSSSVGAIFGQIIANSFLELFPYSTSGGTYSILEIGGGNGRFAKNVLDYFSNNYPHMYKKVKYYMIETSPYHQFLQNEYLMEHLEKIVWLSDINKLDNFEGIVFSNELIDSFPVHKVIMHNGKLQEVYVTWIDRERSFAEVVDDISDKQLIEYFDKQGVVLRDGQTAEVNLEAIKWLSEVNKILSKGFILSIDYGYPSDELYTSYRNDGTLMCYFKHIANDNPYQNVGDQDITSHVNFSVLMEHGKEIGLENVWFTTQSHFLVNNGILNYLQEVDLNSFNERDILKDDALRLNRAIRQLITPGEMGETFKVLLQQKNISNKKYRFLTEIWEQFGVTKDI